MKSIQIKGEARTSLGKKATKELRKQGKVPCVIYGGNEIIHFATEEKSFIPIIYTPDVFIVEVDLNGKKVNTVIKDVQYHPVMDNILHVDFTEVIEGKPVTVELPVKTIGNSVGVINGGKLRIRKRYLKVKGLSEHLPEVLNVDISKVDIGHVIKVENVSYENIELLDTPKALILGVSSSRLAKSMEEELPTEGEEAASEEAASEEAAE